MLITCKRHYKEDLNLYKELSEVDKINFILRKVEEKQLKALAVISDFYNTHKGKVYCAVSWGKDSIIVAHLCLQLKKDIPIVWIKVNPIFNPYCLNVRDLFIENNQVKNYYEYEVNCGIDANGIIHAKGTLEEGFKKAVNNFGENYITGIRSEESAIRTLRSKMYRTTSIKTCAPINYWKYEDIFAYLSYYNLPIHPNYAMLGKGRYDRKHLRVASLGGKRGRERGRYEWENEYYSDYIRKSKE